MKKIIIVLSCLMLSIPLMAINKPASFDYTDIYNKVLIDNDDGIKTYYILDKQTEQEKYEQEQLWKYFKFAFFTGMAIAGWNTRTDYGVIAGTTFIFFAANIKF